MEEIWREIESKHVKGVIDGYYQVSNHGNIRSVSRDLLRSNGAKSSVRGKVLKQTTTPGGYKLISLNADTRCKRCADLVHRIVAYHFIPNPLGLPCINHIDCNKANNSVSNLEWVTYKQNIDHAVLNGLIIISKEQREKISEKNSGARNGMSKLTSTQVIYIYKELSGLSDIDVAKMYDVDRTTIHRIRTGQQWDRTTNHNKQISRPSTKSSCH